MNELILHEDLFPKLVKYLDSSHAAIFIRINRLQREQLDKDVYRNFIQVKRNTEERKRELIVTGGIDIKVQDKNGVCLRTLGNDIEGNKSAVFNPEGSLIVSASYDELRIQDAATGKCLKTLSGHNAGNKSAAFNPEGSLIVSISWDESIKVWDVETGESLRKLIGHTDFVLSAALNSKGSLIVSASSDESIKIWDVASGECLKTLIGHTGFVASAVFDTEGSLIVSASDDKTLKIWNVASGKCLKTLRSHTLGLLQAAFNFEGSLIVSAFHDQLRIQDTATGKCLKTLIGHTDDVLTAAFNSKGTLIVSASSDESIKIWDVASGKCLKTIRDITRPFYLVNFIYKSQLSFTFKNLNQTVQNSIYDKIDSIMIQGDDLYINNMFPQAILKYLECLALFKDENEANAKSLRSRLSQNIALCYFKLGNYSESLYQADKAIVADQSNQKAQQCICDSLYNLGMLMEADERITEFLVNDSQNIDLIDLRDKILNKRISGL